MPTLLPECSDARSVLMIVKALYSPPSRPANAHALKVTNPSGLELLAGWVPFQQVAWWFGAQ